MLKSIPALSLQKLPDPNSGPGLIHFPINSYFG